jgi:putative hydrolase of HD superfamily
MTDRRRAVEFLMEVNRLESVPREGYVMSGIPDAEDVAAHTTGVAAAALVIADRVDAAVDRGRLLTIALLHDVGEARVGDTPLVTKTEADEAEERAAADAIVDGLPERYAAALRDYREQTCLEARIVKAADKLQLIAKVLAYEAEGRGRLDAFWENGRNFYDAGLAEARELFEEIRRMREERRG